MTMNDTITKDVLMHHLTAFGNNDLSEIMKDYTNESEVHTPVGPLKGWAPFVGSLLNILILFLLVPLLK
jgi:hypothetical protein